VLGKVVCPREPVICLAQALAGAAAGLGADKILVMGELERARMWQTAWAIFAVCAFAAVWAMEYHEHYYFYTYLLLILGLVLYIITKRRTAESEYRPPIPPDDDDDSTPLPENIDPVL